MSISYWLDQSSQAADKNFDVVVIGGGIAGLSAAYWLQQRDPRLKVAVIERQRIGFGASGRNAGFVTCGSTEHFIKLNEQFGTEKAVEIWKFSEKNRDLLMEHVIQDQGNALDFRITGSCTVAPSDEHWLKYKKTAQLMREHGLDVSEVSPEEMQKDFGVTGFVGGINFNGDGYIHPIKLLERLRSKIKATIFEGTEVFSVHDQTIKTDKGVITAEKILVAVNAYLPLLFKEYTKHITPGRGQILVTEPLPAFVKGPCYLTKHLCYFRQLPTGHLLIGGFRNLAVQDENTYADATTPVIQDTLYRFVREHFKYGKDAKVAYQWSGIMGFSPDGQMMIGAHPQNKNLHIMAGCSGHGMGLSFHAAKVLVGSVFGEKIPSHLDLARFNH
jgi:glycine/D-amino acid oxidase-like deaminating enzyme